MPDRVRFPSSGCTPPYTAMRDDSERAQINLLHEAYLKLRQFVQAKAKEMQAIRRQLEVYGITPNVHTHVEADISDLDHDPDINAKSAITDVIPQDDLLLVYDQSEGVNKKMTAANFDRRPIGTSLAATTPSPGTAMTEYQQFVRIASCPSGGEIELPNPFQPFWIMIFNDTAESCTVNAKSGHTLSGTAALAAGAFAFYVSVDSTNWRRFG